MRSRGPATRSPRGRASSRTRSKDTNGIYAEYEQVVDRTPRYTAVFFLPWEDHTLEVALSGPQPDWRRANRALEGIVASLRGPSDTAELDPDRGLDDDVVPPSVPDQLDPNAGAAVADISFNGRRRIYQILCWLAHCDRDLAPEERNLLEAFRTRAGIDPEEARELEDAATQSKKSIGARRAERELLVRAVIAIVAADGVFDPQERKRVEAIATAVGIGGEELTRLVEARLGEALG